ncbi:MAG: endolytic transglycosylase MltG, partial [Alphaproteobacteria bacterium]|nr:endolytic transglycosylase MltG [Alphaproteobacteria bacterium]
GDLIGVGPQRPLFRRVGNLAGQDRLGHQDVDGLPPTPIANPGGEAIAAVLDPPASNELFFVADGSGGHAFARTYDEHLANVARWREIERRKAGLPPGAPAPAVPGTSPGVPNAHPPEPAAAPPGVNVPPGAQVIRVPQSAPAQ